MFTRSRKRLNFYVDSGKATQYGIPILCTFYALASISVQGGDSVPPVLVLVDVRDPALLLFCSWPPLDL